MTTITIEENVHFSKTKFVNENELFLYLLEYVQDMDDRENVKNEILKNQESFDYDIIRSNYV